MLKRNDVWLLVRALLGRSPSDRVIDQLVGFSKERAVSGIILGEEFTNFFRPRPGIFVRIPHHHNEVYFDDEVIEWCTNFLGQDDSTIAGYRECPSWKYFLARILLDGGIANYIRQNMAQHRNFALYGELQALAREMGSADGAEIQEDALESRRLIGRAAKLHPGLRKPLMAERRPLSRGSSQLANVAQPEVSHGGDLPSLEELAHPGGQVRLSRCFRQVYAAKRYDLIVRSYDMIVGGRKDVTTLNQYYASLYYSRLLLIMNASRSANEIMERLYFIAGPALSIPDKELRAVLGWLCQSRIRNGRAEEAARLFEEALESNPGDVEAAVQLAVLSRTRNGHLSTLLFGRLCDSGVELPAGRRTLAAQHFLSQGDLSRAMRQTEALATNARSISEVDILLANMHVSAGCPALWRGHLRSYFRRFGLGELFLNACEGFRCLDLQDFSEARARSGPLVSIVMTSFNSAEYLELAVRSVLRQTHSNIELIVVDDCSSDQSRDILIRMSKADSRVRCIFNEVNVGTYVSKNSAVCVCKGDFVTFHDSDDWMHPERIEKHLDIMSDETIKLSYSKWIRMNKDGVVEVRGGGEYMHDNPASTFMGRGVFEEIGYFDGVRTGADSEFLWRAIRCFGREAVVSVALPLAIGLHHDNSLTQSGAAAFDEFRFSAVRLEYWESWVRWQLQSYLTDGRLYIGHPLRERLFEAPPQIIS